MCKPRKDVCRRLRRPVAAFALALLFFTLSARCGAADKPFARWNWRLPVIVQGYTRPDPLTNFPLLVLLGTNITGFQYAEFKSPEDGADLRFADSNETVALHHAIERWDTQGVSWVRVQLPVVAGAATTTLHVYWGRATNALPVQDPDMAWSESFAGAWLLGETNGAVRDSTTNHNHGSVAGGVFQAATGKVDGAYWLDGADDVVSIPDHNSLDFGTGDFTVLAWARVEYEAAASIVSKGAGFDSYNNAGWGLTYAGSPQSLYVLIGNGSSHIEYQTSYGALASWKQIGFKRQANRLYFLDDGRTIDTGMNIAGSVNNAVPVTLGRNDCYPANFLRGFVDDVQLSPMARSSNWVWASWLNVASNTPFLSYGTAVRQPQDFGITLQLF